MDTLTINREFETEYSNYKTIQNKQRSLFAWLQEAHPDVFKQWECVYYVEQSVIHEWEQ
jgi:hypothetical protein